MSPAVAEASDDALPEFRRRVREVIRRRVVPLLDRAESERRFPHEAVSTLGELGILRERWEGEVYGDTLKSVVLYEELGLAGLTAIAAGVSLHCETTLSILRRFGRSSAVGNLFEQALRGELLGCIAASERGGGSDLGAIATEARQVQGGWLLRGEKWYVSPATSADFVLVLCRRSGAGSRDGQISLALVERDGFKVGKTLETLGARGLGTARVTVDALLPEGAFIGPVGAGLYVLSYGLTFERLAIAAGSIGAATLATRLAATHLRRRSQFGQPLMSQQALRLRLAELAAELMVARRAVYSAAANPSPNMGQVMREWAAIKVVAARLAGDVVGECMHMFGGKGYLEDETPLARLWRDTRLSRLGAGSDEILLELFAATLEGDNETYERWIVNPEVESASGEKPSTELS